MIDRPEVLGEGWRGFTDLGFIVNALSMLVLATVLGAALGMQPRHDKTTNSLEEIETPQIYTMYAVIGGIVGIMVVKYGLIVGFVLFGIGGLIRFRTILQSATRTGRVILVTLVGLSCGLNLPHVAVLSAAFGWILICFLDSRITYQLQVKGIDPDKFAATSAAYRSALEKLTCRVLNEKKSPRKKRVTYIFRCPRVIEHDHLEEFIAAEVAPELQATTDWEID
jgi:hypothetical protein